MNIDTNTDTNTNYVISVHDMFRDARSDPTLKSQIDVDELLAVIEDQKHDHLADKSLKSIAKEILDELTAVFGLHKQPMFTKQTIINRKQFIKELYNKLKEYRLINEIFEIHRGKHVRWIRRPTSMVSLPPALTAGGIVMDIKFLDTGTHVLIKSPGGRFLQFKYDDCVIFQMLSADEQLILAAHSLI